MSEIKTYLTFVIISVVLVGVLAFLYSPSDQRTNTVSVVENLESKSLENRSQSADEPTKEPDELDSPEDPEDEEKLQTRRIHFTQILLRKQKQLEDLQDKKFRNLNSNDEAIDQQIAEVEKTIEELMVKIRNM